MKNPKTFGPITVGDDGYLDTIERLRNAAPAGPWELTQQYHGLKNLAQIWPLSGEYLGIDCKIDDWWQERPEQGLHAQAKDIGLFIAAMPTFAEWSVAMLRRSRSSIAYLVDETQCDCATLESEFKPCWHCSSKIILADLDKGPKQ